MKVSAQFNFRQFLPVAAVLLLCACAGQPMPAPQGTQGTEASINQSKASEAAGWTTVGQHAGSRCGATAAPPARERAVEQSDCVTALIKQHVLPVAAFPDLLLASRSDARRLALSYAGGKLTPVQYQTRSKGRMVAYRQKWQMQAATDTLWAEAIKPVTTKRTAQKPAVARL